MGERIQGELVRHRGGLLGRLNAWRKRTPLNPYWIERTHLHRAAKELSKSARGRLLDIGGAERPYGELFEPRVERYVELEYPPMADNLAPETWKFLSRIRGLIDVFGDGNRLPFAAETFDSVLCLEVLEHVPQPELMLGEISRVLRPGGRALMTVPFSAPLHQLPFDYYRFTPEGLRSLLTRSGLAVESITPRGNFASATGAHLSQFLMRTLAARAKNKDGSVTLGRLRAPFVLPVIAAVQMGFHAAARFSRDDTLCLGFTVVARKTPCKTS